MSKLKKKAVSAVVATVLIIMITVAAVGVIWMAIMPMINDSLNFGTICNEASNDISVNVANTCIAKVCSDGYTEWNSTHCNKSGTIEAKVNGVKVQIEKGSNEKIILKGVEIIITDKNGNSKSVTARDTNSGNITGNLPTNYNSQVITVSDNSITENATSVKIAPIIESGKKEKSCGPTKAVELVACTQ